MHKWKQMWADHNTQNIEKNYKKITSAIQLIQIKLEFKNLSLTLQCFILNSRRYV